VILQGGYLFFLLYCISVQLNDVDAGFWMVVYSLAFLTAVYSMSMNTKLNSTVAIIALIIALLLAIPNWPLNEEEYRELGGLILIAFGHRFLLN